MKHLVVSEHTEECMEASKRLKSSNDEFSQVFHSSCNLNKKNFLFYHNNEFYLLTYHSCIAGFDKYDFFTRVITSAVDGSKDFDYYDINRGRNLDREFKEARLRGANYKTHLEEVNYVYSNSANKSYAIATTISFSDKLISQLNSDEKLKECIESLTKLGLHYIIPDAQRLHSENSIYISEKEIVKTIDNAIKLIKNKTK